MEKLIRDIREVSTKLGYDTPGEDDWDRPFVMAAHVARLHGELSEAMDVWQKNGSPAEFLEELADVQIYLLCVAGMFPDIGADFEGIVRKKLTEVSLREPRHGGRRL